MFGLTSTYGDIYEGHIIRMNKEKLVLLLASAHHSHIQFSSPVNLKTIPDESVNALKRDDFHFCHFRNLLSKKEF